jgi:hypothetical protein
VNKWPDPERAAARRKASAIVFGLAVAAGFLFTPFALVLVPLDPVCDRVRTVEACVGRFLFPIFATGGTVVLSTILALVHMRFRNSMWLVALIGVTNAAIALLSIQASTQPAEPAHQRHLYIEQAFWLTASLSAFLFVTGAALEFIELRRREDL